MGVLTLPEKEHECMKFLSTSCQLAIVQAAGNNIVREIHIWQGKLHITMMQAFGRGDGYDERGKRKLSDRSGIEIF